MAYMCTSQDYLIADHLIRLEGEALTALVNTIDGFSPFAADTASETSSAPVLTITQWSAALAAEPKRQEELYRFEAEDDVELISTFCRTDHGYLFRMDHPEGNVIMLWCNRECRQAYVKGDLTPCALSVRAVRFAIWIAFGMAVSHLATVAIHTSTITYQGRNVLFLGESGTGKSTHTRLWREHVTGASLLNDDSPIVRVTDGVPYVYGSPWSGKTPCYKNEHYPLAACVRLSQAPHNRMRRLNVIESFAAIHPSCPPDFAYDDYLYDGITSTLDKLLATVPFYHLECLPDAEAAELSRQTIFG